MEDIQSTLTFVPTQTHITSTLTDAPANRKYFLCSLIYVTKRERATEVIYNKEVSRPDEEEALLSDSLSRSGRLSDWTGQTNNRGGKNMSDRNRKL